MSGFLRYLMRGLQRYYVELSARADPHGCVYPRNLESAQQKSERARDFYLGGGRSVGDFLHAGGGVRNLLLARALQCGVHWFHGGQRRVAHGLLCPS